MHNPGHGGPTPGGDMQLWARGTHSWKGHAAPHIGGGGSQEGGTHPWDRHSTQCRDVQPWIHLGKGRAAWARGIPLPEGIPSSGRHEGPSKLTVTRHADQQALLEAALLAAVAVDADDRAVLVLEALLVLDVLLDAAAEEALRGEAGGITWGPRSVTGAPSPIPGPIPVPCSPRRRGRRSGSRRRRLRRPCRAAPSR